MKLSVVVPTYNDATYVDRLLECLTKQVFKDFEVIVSDASSSDDIDKVCANYAKKLDIKLIFSEPKGPAHGRNVGAKTSKAEWLLFLDADNEITDKYFLDKILSSTSKNSWKISSARVKVKGNLLERFGNLINYRYIKLLVRTNHPVAPGWCILTKRDVFVNHSGFNEKIQFGEDYDYVSRAGKKSFGFVEETFYYMDLRRFRSEGFKFAIKGFLNEVYRHTHGYNLEKNPINYEFGKHKPRK